MKWTQLPDKEQLQGKHKAASEQTRPQRTNQMGFQGLQDQHELDLCWGLTVAFVSVSTACIMRLSFRVNMFLPCFKAGYFFQWRKH